MSDGFSDVPPEGRVWLAGRDPADLPIEACRNLGAVTGRELRDVGVHSLARLRALGWERAWALWRSRYPERIHLIALKALAGAEACVDWRLLPPGLEAAVKAAHVEARAAAGQRTPKGSARKRKT